jgi:pyruvate dehydrogenase (quinone)
VKPANPVLSPSPEEIRQLAELLNSGEAFTILGGAGYAGAHAELMAVADKLKSPIVSALRGREYIQFENPYDV